MLGVSDVIQDMAGRMEVSTQRGLSAMYELVKDRSTPEFALQAATAALTYFPNDGLAFGTGNPPSGPTRRGPRRRGD